MKKLLLSIVSAFMIFALSAQVTENFSDYTVDGKLAQQAQAMGKDYWTTWSGTVGAAEDGVIKELSSNKCGYFSGNSGTSTKWTDQVLLLGGKATGAWDFSMKMYVPAGNRGYFNILGSFAGTASIHALQVYFGCTGESGNALTPGVGTMHIDGSNSAGFTFTHDAWTDIKIFIDLDNDNAEIFINGASILSWTYSNGTFGEGCPRVIDALDIYPPTQNNSNFYIDDIVFAPALNVIYETGFDDVTAGARVAQSYPDWWTTYENAPGTSEDALITTEQFETAPNSAKCVDGNDLIFKAGNKASGAYTIDFDMFIPTNGTAYFNLMQIFDGNDGDNNQWAADVFFNMKSNPYSLPLGTYTIWNDVVTNFTAPNFNEWFHVAVMIDLDNDIANIKINDTQILEWQYSIDVNGDAGTRQFAAVDFWPPIASSVYYIDNFKYAGGGDNYAIMNVTPTSISEAILPGADVTKTITVENTGTSMGDFYTWVELDIDPSSGSNNYTITYSSENLFGSVGYADECTVEAAAKYPLSAYCDKVGTYITKVAYFMRNASVDNKLIARVYGVGAYNSPGEILAEMTINNPTLGAWNEVTLSTPVLLDGQDFWVAFEMIQPTGDHLLTYDDGIATENTNWTRRNGGGWSQMLEVQGEPTGILMIKAFAQGDVVPSCWISPTGTTYGSVPMNSSKTFDVVFNATGLNEGVYTANIKVKTNDTENPLFTIPCTIIVGNSALITVNPTSLMEVVTVYDEPLTKTITVLNSGNIDGEYTVAPSTVEWLTLSGNTSATLAPGGSETFDVIFTADETMENTTYTTEIKISTSNNDITIPCTLIVNVSGIGGYSIKTFVFPNPANDQVTVKSTEMINSIQIFNNMGQMVYASTVNGNEITIPTTNLNAGIYFLKVNTAKSSQNVKLIIK